MVEIAIRFVIFTFAAVIMAAIGVGFGLLIIYNFL